MKIQLYNNELLIEIRFKTLIIFLKNVSKSNCWLNLEKVYLQLNGKYFSGYLLTLSSIQGLY